MLEDVGSVYLQDEFSKWMVEINRKINMVPPSS